MKPILFSTPMVQAILYGRKTMTRRVCNIPDGWEYNGWGRITSKHPKQGKLGIFIRKQDGDFVLSDIITAKYQVGDVLWVRETWCKGVLDGDATQYKEYWCIIQPKDSKRIFYKADCTEETGYCDSDKLVKWKPSIFMPKEACRIFLRVTNVRVERLQDISVEDIKKEGAPLITITGNNEDFINSKLKGWWYDLWNSINGKGAWEANPYVFVYEFERIEKPC